MSNLKSMRRFAEAYPDFPFLQVPLAKMENIPIGQVALDQFKEDDKGFVQVELAQITWYHHISLLSKVKDIAERAYYITETAQNGWSRDVMLMQIANGYIHAKGHAINNLSKPCHLFSPIWRSIFLKTHTILVFWAQWHSKMSLTLRKH